ASMNFVLSQIRMRIGQSAHSDHISEQEKLSLLIAEYIHFSLEYKDYIMMLMSEPVIHMNKDIYSIMMELRSDSIRVIYHGILDKYGHSAHPYSMDAAVILQAMISEY